MGSSFRCSPNTEADDKRSCSHHCYISCVCPPKIEMEFGQAVTLPARLVMALDTASADGTPFPDPDMSSPSSSLANFSFISSISARKRLASLQNQSRSVHARRRAVFDHGDDLPEGPPPPCSPVSLASRDLGSALSLSSTAPILSVPQPPRSSSAGVPRPSSLTILCDRRTELRLSSSDPPPLAAINRSTPPWPASRQPTKQQQQQRQQRNGSGDTTRRKDWKSHHDTTQSVYTCKGPSFLRPRATCAEANDDDPGLALQNTHAERATRRNKKGRVEMINPEVMMIVVCPGNPRTGWFDRSSALSR